MKNKRRRMDNEKYGFWMMNKWRKKNKRRRMDKDKDEYRRIRRMDKDKDKYRRIREEGWIRIR